MTLRFLLSFVCLFVLACAEDRTPKVSQAGAATSDSLATGAPGPSVTPTASSPPPIDTASIQQFRVVELSISWTAASLVSADFNGDGIPDFAATGTKPDSAFLGVVSGDNANPKHWVLRFAQA